MAFNTLLFDIQENIAHITLNRPEAANSLNPLMGKELMAATKHCSENSKVRAVLLSGAGTIFCAGGDLKEFNAAGDQLQAILKEATSYFHSAISCLTKLNSPVIAAVHGSVAGAGLSLALASDIVISAESTRFTVAYTRAGLTPDGGATYFLPRIVGLKRALELTLTNRNFSAMEAMEWGIVTKVVPDQKLLEEAKDFATSLASGAIQAYGASKRLLYGGTTESLETQLELESRSIGDSSRTLESREGVQAFLQKRAPKFKTE